MAMAERGAARRTVRWASGINVLAGIWLVLAPFALAYDDVSKALWNDIILGVAIFVLALARESNPLSFEGVSWTNFVLGIWLIVAPFIVTYSDTTSALWNDIVLGVIVLVMASWSAVASRRFQPSEPGPTAG